MKVIFATLSVIVVALSVVGLATNSSFNPQEQPSIQNTEKRGTIAWHVMEAKKKGENKVALLPVEDTPTIISSLENALSRYTVVVVQPVEKRSYIASEGSLITWNKLKVIEVLSQPSVPACSGCLASLHAPPDIPRADDEILVPTSGGHVVVDGVDVVSGDKFLGKHFLSSKKYLLFLSLDLSRGVGRLQPGPYGVFTIDSEERIQAIMSENAPLKRELETQFANSFNILKGHLERRP